MYCNNVPVNITTFIMSAGAERDTKNSFGPLSRTIHNINLDSALKHNFKKSFFKFLRPIALLF